MVIFCCLASSSSDHGEEDSIHHVQVYQAEKSMESSTGQIDLISSEGETYQTELWQLEVSVGKERLTKAATQLSRAGLPAPGLTDVGFNDQDQVALGAEHFLHTLAATYASNGLAQKMQRVHELFGNMQPFVAAVTAMTQSSLIASLVWGSISLVLLSILRVSSFFDDARGLLQTMAKTLPRFQAYTQVLHTPRLHSALRDVYRIFLDLCFMMLGCFQSNYCYTVVRLQWPVFAADFKAKTAELAAANVEFEKEAQLADVQERTKRDEQVITYVRAALGPDQLSTNITTPRNAKFTGRDDVLALLHSRLEASFKGDIEDRQMCSCLVHAVGGMGKSETALEYTYRFRGCYSHIFWIHSQTRNLLVESMVDIASNFLPLEVAGLQTSMKIQRAMQWFQSTDRPWLLVYDNAEDVDTLCEFWPVSTKGAIIVTSQNPLLAHLTQTSIQLEPLTGDEGSALIQSYLDRGHSEEEAARDLANSLGGLPLAIVHFTGSIARSQCPITQISRSLNTRLKSSAVWKTQNGSLGRSYRLTLDTVWDLAIARLSADATELLEFIAFLDPDQIPVELFIGDTTNKGQNVVAADSPYWDMDRFNAAMTVLCERHLVERHVVGDLDVLRTHRALQRSVLQRLDLDLALRQQRFNDVVSFVREALPVANVAKRSDASQFPVFAKWLPQVLALLASYSQSDPKIGAVFGFATVLKDAGFYGFAQQNTSMTASLLQTGEAVCAELQPSQPLQVRPVLGDIWSWLQRCLQDSGGMREALAMTERAMALRDEQVEGVPREAWTELDIVDVARSRVDNGRALTQLNRFEEAKPRFDEAVALYRTVDNPVRLAHAMSCGLAVLACLQRRDEVRDLAARTMEDVERECGASNPLTLQTKFYSTNAYFTIGDLQQALTLGKSVLDGRLDVFGRVHNLTLATQYFVAVCCQYAGDVEGAETMLREILTVGTVNGEWREEDVTRARFRLSVLLRAQNRPTEAKKFGVDDVLAKLRPAAGDHEYTDADDMALLDSEVTVAHGRTAGVWSNGTMW